MPSVDADGGGRHDVYDEDGDHLNVELLSESQPRPEAKVVKVPTTPLVIVSVTAPPLVSSLYICINVDTIIE